MEGRSRGLTEHGRDEEALDAGCVESDCEQGERAGKAIQGERGIWRTRWWWSSTLRNRVGGLSADTPPPGRKHIGCGYHVSINVSFNQTM